MLIQGAFEKARHYIETHSKPDASRKYEFFPCITFSRETGAGADLIGERLVNYLEKFKLPGSPRWTIFDKNLITKVLEDFHLPMHLEKFLVEDKYSAVSSIITELLTGEPSTWILVNKEIQTVYRLGKIGNAIIIGRGSNFITSKLKNSFHVRLVAPLEQRVKHVEELYNLDKREAALFIKKEDTARKNFVYSHFHKDLEDPLHYHLVLNTALLTHSQCAKIIGKAVLKRFKKLFAENIKSGNDIGLPPEIIQEWLKGLHKNN
ncbi:MAG: cytidylate kinase-like family protein [Ignavibacteriaceae bacterium]